jgi:hypothetical protein
VSQVRNLASTSVPFRPDDGANAKFSTNGDEMDYSIRGEGVANLEHKVWLPVTIVSFTAHFNVSSLAVSTHVVSKLMES